MQTASPLANRAARTAFNRAMGAKGVPAKACPTCFVVKAGVQFGQAKSRVDGLRPRCQACHAACQAAYRAAPAGREKERAYYATPAGRAKNRARTATARARYRATPVNLDGAKRCAKCELTKPKTEFARGAGQAGGLTAYCLPCMALKAHERRALKHARTPEPFSSADLFADWEDHELFACFYCAGPLDDGLHIEHFIPLADGGLHALPFLVPACPSCNLSKGTRDGWEFLAEALAERGGDLNACLADLT